MAKWQIDRFKVKPSGIFASWRERAVFVDEDGVVTSECIPGKECMNLPCISDYNKKDRRYSNGALITQYCNTTTHSRWSIYAQDCEPFAYHEEDVNVPACGYEEPLPEPSVPSNPFGTSPYGLYVFYNFCDKNNVEGVVNIYRKNYDGDPLQIESGNESPVILRYKDTDNKFEQIISLECILTFIATENFQLSYLYAGDQREFLAEVIKSGQLKFKGFIIPDSCVEPFAYPGYPVTVRATDGLGALQKLTYPLPASNSTDIRQRWIDILAYALSLTNLNINIRTAVNLYDQAMSNGMDDDPMAQSSVSPLRFTDGSSIDTAYEVLKKVCNQFTATLYQDNGEWVFIRNSELTQEFIRTRLYLYTGFFVRSEEVRNIRSAGVSNTDFITESGSQISIGNAYKRAVARLDYGNIAALVENGSFEQWDGQNFSRWTKYGAISVSRFQKSIPGTNGARLLIDNYAALFNQPYQPGKYMESSPIVGIQGDKIKMTFSVSNTKGTSILRFRIKVGQYWLIDNKSDDPDFVSKLHSLENGLVNQGSIQYSWVEKDTLIYGNPYTEVFKVEKTFARVYINNSSRFMPDAFNTISIQIPELPVTDQMYIQIYGFENQKSSYPASGIAIDDIKMQAESATNSNISEGLFYLSEQLGFYTETPDEIELSFGEYNSSSGRRPARVTSGITHDDFYTIFTKDNSYATGWKTYGDSGEYVPIGIAATRAIMKNYQKPYMFYRGVLSGSDFSHLNIIRFVVECESGFSEKTFMQLGVTYDLVNNKISGTFVEMFSRSIFLNEAIIDNYPGTELPPFIQNPTQPPPLIGDGIFTPEFTEQFI